MIDLLNSYRRHCDPIDFVVKGGASNPAIGWKQFHAVTKTVTYMGLPIGSYTKPGLNTVAVGNKWCLKRYRISKYG